MKELYNEIKVEAGTYYIGDLCYVIKDDSMWDKVCDAMFPNDAAKDGLIVVGGYQMISFSTMYGDGTYTDNHGNEYPVDAGMIGLISVQDIEKINGGPVDMEFGNVSTFEKDFICKSNNGELYFGQYVIDTGYDEEEDEEEYEDDY